LKIKKIDAFGNNSIRVPFFRPYIDKEDIKSIGNSLRQPLLTDGPILQEFESKFSKFTGAKFAVGVSNATSALQLSLKALGIQKNDEVILPDMTFVATGNAILNVGATPVIVDVNDDMNISLDSIKENITSKTKAIIPVHFAGKICDIKNIKKIATTNNLFLIEDCAHAIGAKFENKHAGTFGNAGCFSFYPTKNITTIEGGMVICNSKNTLQRIQSFRNHGITRTLKQRFSDGKPWDYDEIEPGYNFRLDEIRASLGISQLKKISKLNSLRRKACEYYNSKLNNIDGIESPEISKKNDNAFHLYIIKIKKEYGLSRDKLFLKLLNSGVRTSVHYKPLHKFTVFKKEAKIKKELKNSKILYEEILSLPLFPMITKTEQNYVIEKIKQFQG
jgi:perosamine synthetase